MKNRAPSSILQPPVTREVSKSDIWNGKRLGATLELVDKAYPHKSIIAQDATPTAEPYVSNLTLIPGTIEGLKIITHLRSPPFIKIYGKRKSRMTRHHVVTIMVLYAKQKIDKKGSGIWKVYRISQRSSKRYRQVTINVELPSWLNLSSYAPLHTLQL